jgi:ERF superfamily protein
MNNEITLAPELQSRLSPAQPSLVNLIATYMDNPSVDANKLREMIQLAREVEADEAKREYQRALHRVTLQMPAIKKDGSVLFKDKLAFKFATWENIMSIVGPILSADGMGLSFDTKPRTAEEGGGLMVTGTLWHVSGHSTTASIPVPLDTSGGKNPIQAYGSALSYGKRYTATSLLNIVTEGEDDDGRAGGKKYISAAQAAELSALAQEVGRDEASFLQRLFGDTVRSFAELEDGTPFLAARNTLQGILSQRRNPGGRS